jgi:flagellar basal-body rod protein FlgB
MISKLDNNFSLLEASFKALSQRQEILSSNVANESTPNYKAQDFDFKRAISDVVSTSEMAKQSAVIAGKPHLPSYVFFRNNVAGVQG